MQNLKSVMERARKISENSMPIIYLQIPAAFYLNIYSNMKQISEVNHFKNLNCKNIWMK